MITTAPGEESPVDYGDGPIVRDGATGRHRCARLFVLSSSSEKAVRLLTPNSSTNTWAQLHEVAFRRFGGMVHWVVLDNLPEDVRFQPYI